MLQRFRLPYYAILILILEKHEDVARTGMMSMQNQCVQTITSSVTAPPPAASPIVQLLPAAVAVQVLRNIPRYETQAC